MAQTKYQIIGFADEKSFVKNFANVLKVHPTWIREKKFAAGEIHLIVPPKVNDKVIVITNIQEKPSSLFRALMLSSMLRRHSAKNIVLLAPWIAYGRQDSDKHPAGLIVADELQRHFDHIITLDVHSPICIRAFKRKLTNILPCIDKQLIKKHHIDLILAPDKGARSRAENLATTLNLPFLVMQKKRQENTVTTKLSKSHVALRGKNILIVDDIADSGKTLIVTAKLLRKHDVGSLYAFVTHSINIQQLRKKLQKFFSHVESAFDHSLGNISPQVTKQLSEEVN